ncbi:MULTISPECIES: hypothetical protein [unclassified Ruegeria]|uniref:hypothetical protein n=1 Tax=unclassified Ruegeria TaxID=2625375 RepID=UPI0014883599|nr:MULTISPECIES: hypothetical protein [unclassified Ruegeria]NOD75828.1 hypothetical protein [Ruegeria sp. HKCCD4332]
MVHLPSDITETEMVRANGGQPLKWPNDPLHQIAYCLWLRHNLKAFVDTERIGNAVMIGSFGNQDNAHRMHECGRKLAHMNGIHLYHGWPTGLSGVMKLILSDPKDWPCPVANYKL